MENASVMLLANVTRKNTKRNNGLFLLYCNLKFTHRPSATLLDDEGCDTTQINVTTVGVRHSTTVTEG